jgi:hypothetical protein
VQAHPQRGAEAGLRRAVGYEPDRRIEGHRGGFAVTCTLPTPTLRARPSTSSTRRRATPCRMRRGSTNRSSNSNALRRPRPRSLVDGGLRPRHRARRYSAMMSCSVGVQRACSTQFARRAKSRMRRW